MFHGREKHFHSLDEFLGYIDDTIHIDHGGDQDSINLINAYGLSFYGPRLPDFLQQCRTLTGEFPGLVARVEALAAQLEPALPQTPSVKRVRTWGKQGSSINPHRVLRGQLSTAWRTTRREVSLSDRGPLCIVVPTLYSARFEREDISWMAAVPLALAQVIEESGRRCELWGFAYTLHNIWDGHTPFRSLVCLKTAQEPWSLHGPVYTIHRAFTRRLVFRLMETLGKVTGPYGSMRYEQETFDQQAMDALQAFAGVPASRVICGPWPVSTRIQSTTEAISWITQKLSTLSAQEEVNAWIH